MKFVFLLILINLSDESPMYLVESVIGGDKNVTEDKESVFIFLKHPYLVEKDPVSGQVSDNLRVEILH